MKHTLTQLNHASLVARHGSFSEAARQCHVAQPTISNNVSDLEEILGKRLFERSTRRVELTPFGRILMPVIDDALASAKRVISEAEALINPEMKLLRVAFTPLIDISRINALCAGYRTSHPGVEIIFKECTHDSLEERLRNEQVDVVCAHDVKRHRDFERCALFSDQLHYLPVNADVTSFPKSVSLNVVAKHTLLLTMGSCGLAPTTQSLFDAEELDPPLYAGRAMTHAGLQEWVELGLGGAILPDSRITGTAEQFPKVTVKGKPKSLQYEAVWLKSSRSTSHLKAFFAQLPKVSQALLDESGAWG